MSTRLHQVPRAPYVSQIVLGGETHRVRHDPTTKKLFIGDYEADAFIEKLGLQQRDDVLNQLLGSEFRELDRRAAVRTPFEIHRQRRRRT